MIKISGLKKSFSQNEVLKNISFELKKGEILSVLGGSGSGKSTLLRIIAGLENASKVKEFKLNGTVSMMFQDYALFPHLSVSENIKFALHKLPKNARQKRCDELLNKFNISELTNRRCDEISGGQAQRVAFARSVASGCEILLLDEPFSNIDASLKQNLRSELKSMLKASNITAIMVTHDIEDAYFISDKIALISEGEIVDLSTPKGLYFAPKSSKAAQFLGGLNVVEEYEKLDDSDPFFAWIKSKSGIFGVSEVRLSQSGDGYSAMVVESIFMGAFYHLKVDYKGVIFMILANSYEYKPADFICFEVVEAAFHLI